MNYLEWVGLFEEMHVGFERVPTRDPHNAQAFYNLKEDTYAIIFNEVHGPYTRLFMGGAQRGEVWEGFERDVLGRDSDG